MTLAQIGILAEAEIRRVNHIQASAMEGLMACIGGMMDKDANRQVTQYLKKLRDDA